MTLRRIAGFRWLCLATWAVLATALVGLIVSLPSAGTPGWDESNHAFAALRMSTALRSGDLAGFAREIVRSDFYPPLGRLGLALGFLLGGAGFAAPRAATAVAWVATLWFATRLARRIAREHVGAESGVLAGDVAAFVAAILGATCWIGAAHARTCFLESWSSLSIALAVELWLRAHERRTQGAWTLVGLALVAAFLVKYTYSLVLIAAIAVSVGLDACVPFARGDSAGAPSTGDRPHAPWAALASCVSVLAWWFVLPLPGGFVLGAEHRSMFAEYLTKAAALEGLHVVDLAIIFPLMACISLPSCALQLAGIGLGCTALVPHARDVPSETQRGRPSTRLVTLVALGGFAAFAAYPYRIERFVIPTAFACWSLGGALFAVLVSRVRSRPVWLRPLAGTTGVAVLVGTAGIGSRALLFCVRGEPSNASEHAYMLANLHSWRVPCAHVLAPSAGPDGTQSILDFAARELDPHERFAWIGGTCTELPLALVRWRLFQATSDRSILAWDPAAIDHLWSDPGWDEAGFRAWADAFPQLVALDPPDPRDRRARHFERKWVEWLARDPAFREVARTEITLEHAGRHQVVVYRRNP